MDTIPTTSPAPLTGAPAGCALPANEYQVALLAGDAGETPATRATAAAAITEMAEIRGAASHAINPAEPGSAAAMFERYPGRKHPAEVVLAALLRSRAVDLPDGHAYRLGADLTLGRVGVGPDDEDGYVITHDMPLGAFLRLCAEMPFNDLFHVGCDTALAGHAVERRRARARLAARGAPHAAPAAA